MLKEIINIIKVEVEVIVKKKIIFTMKKKFKKVIWKKIDLNQNLYKNLKIVNTIKKVNLKRINKKI